ncbi:hypothetical protein SUGI_0110560 [Cryptomeria japonica]|nr:hypothetical protein SUGI_0110560 [Cryptomeria japonica]
MASWIAVAELGAGFFVAVVACTLAAVTVALSLCAMRSRKYDKSPSDILVAKNMEEGLTAYDHPATEERESLWQRNILMGERCQPPEFSGLIIYDNMGNRIPKFPPKSPGHIMASLPC